MIWQVVDPIFVGDEMRCETTLTFSVLKADLCTQVVLPPAAKVAFPTHDDWFDCHSISRLYLGNFFPDLDNITR